MCSGIEAASVAWNPLGWEAAWFSEIEPFPCAVLKHHYPTVPNYGDMTKFKDWPDEPIDLLSGGTPCQSFSVAGLRKGLDDPRGDLMLTFGAIAAKYRPTWLVWENVPGVLSSNGGRDFGTFLGMLGQLGYGFAYRILDAQHFGVPQRRRRVFVVGCVGDWRRAAAVLFERHSLSGDIAPRRASGQRVANALTERADRGGTNSEGQRLITKWWDGGDVASTLTKANANGAQRMPDKDNFGAVLQPVAMRESGHGYWMQDEIAGTLRAEGEDRPSRPGHVIGDQSEMQVRRLTPTECERLQGFPDGYSAIPWRGKPAGECPDSPRYKALGNSWAVPVVRWIGERINAVQEIREAA